MVLSQPSASMKRARGTDDDGDDAFDDSDDLMARAEEMMEFDDDPDGSDSNDDDGMGGDDTDDDNDVAVQVNGHAAKQSSSSVLMTDEPPDLATADLDEDGNVVQLKIDALLSSVRCPSRTSSKVTNLVALLEKLEHVLLSSKPITPAPAAEAVAKLGKALPFEDPRIQLPEVRWQLAYEPPVSIIVGGSWPMGIAVKWKGKHGWTIDVLAEMPKSLLQEKDVKDFRYFYKRAFWLAHLHNVLERANLPVSCRFEALAGDHRRPILHLQPFADGSPLDFTKTRATIRIIPCFRCSESPIDITKLHPQRNNVRIPISADSMSDTPTPKYNSSLAADGCQMINQETLQQLCNLGYFQQAVLLLKVWSYQRSHRDIAGLQHVSSILTTLLAHLVSANRKGIQRLSPSSGPWQMFKACIGFLAKHDFNRQPVLSGNSIVSWATDDWKNRATVLTDLAGCTNLLAEVPLASLHRLADDAKQTLSSFRLGDNLAFEAALLKRCDEDHMRFDHTAIITLPLSAAILQDADSSPRQNQLTLSVADSISRALTDRCKTVTVLQQPLSEPGYATYRLGLNINMENATRIIEYGPAADDLDVAKKFKQFWGNKSEIRRFKDGRILESVLWEATGPAERQVIFVQILRHILSLHLNVAASDIRFYAGPYDRLLLEAPQVCRALYNNDPREVGFSAIMAALDTLSKDLRSLKGVPLKITGIQPVSASLRYSSTFVPGSYRPKGLPYMSPSANFTQVHEFNLSFESSGRWPEDLAAIQRVKGALLCKIGESLTDNNPGTQCSAHITPDALNNGANISLDVLTAQGYIFRLSVTYLRERLLLENALLEDDITVEAKASNASLLKAWYIQNMARPAHHAAISNLQSRFPAYSTTVRILKRWVAAHLLSRHFSGEALELLAAKVFLDETSVYAPPASGSAGFARALQLIVSWNWQKEPLLVQLYTPTDDTEPEHRPAFPHAQKLTADRLWSERAKKGNSTATGVWGLVTEQDLLGGAFTSHRPNKSAANRIQQLAQATLGRLSTLVAAADERVQPLFVPSTQGYDFILHLDKTRVSRHRQHVSPCHKLLAKRARTAQLIRHGFDPVAAFLERAEAYLSDTAGLFYDENGGLIVAGLFNPGLYDKSRNFRIAQDYPVTARPLGLTADKNQVNFDRNAVVDKLVEISEGLVLEVELPRQACRDSTPDGSLN